MMEAENYELLDPKSDPSPYRFANTSPSYSGTGYMETANIGSNNNTNWSAASELRYRFVVPSTGTYTALIRRITPSGGDDSAFVGVDGVQVGGSEFINSTQNWAWSSSVSLGSLTAGVHTFHLRKREDGMLVDRVALIRSGSATPMGASVGPAESPRGPAPGSLAPVATSPLQLGSGEDPLRAVPLSWSPAGADVLVWHLERAAAGGTFERVASFAPETNSGLDLGLPAGSAWRYRLVAANLSGELTGPEFAANTAQIPNVQVLPAAGGISLIFATESEFETQVEVSTDLDTWTLLGTPIRATTSHNLSLSGTTWDGPRFYRLRVLRP